ncbi:hypothetical protein F3Y22_tig00110548pilonHSYRG00498 [Hibiscus syriacus]|uniref:Uncharacterized protein n=1 Tax=Hibiscus syriacus TaxID=106335 RepID=A0A6A3A9Q3_HIBSY|nr:hypothetical protein F3Y22_tig00110548pilonHSYRG00498 [Hibiscus syriacus]
MQSQGQGSNLTLRFLLENRGMNPNDGHISGNHGTIAPSILSGSQGQGFGYGPLQLDLNEPLPLTLDLSRTGRSSGNQQILASCDSLSPIMIHSGSGGYVVEETTNREGLLPTNGQSRLLCKRRASEVPQPQNAVLNIPTAASSSNNGSHLARTVAASSIQIGQTDSYQRNTRLRTFLGQQNPGIVNSRHGNSSMLHHQQQPTVGVSNQLQQLTGGIPSHLQQQQQNIVGAHNQLQTPLSSQYWNGPTMPSHGHQSFVSVVTIQPGNVQPNEHGHGNSSFLGNAAASSGIQSGSGMYNSPLSSVGHHQPSMAEQTIQRLQYMLDSTEAWRMAHNHPTYTESSHTVRDLEATVRNNNYRPTQVPPRPGAIAADRHK